MNTKTTEPIEDVVEERPNDIEEMLQGVVPYWRPIAAAVALLVGVVAVFGVLKSGQQKAREGAWTDYFTATTNRDGDVLQQLADSSSGEVAGWAQYTAAQAKLIEGSGTVYENRDAAREAFTEAVTAFGKVMERTTSEQVLLKKRALYGLAQAHEGLNDLGSAKVKYQQVVDKWPDSAIAEQAKKQIARLDDSGSKEFYDWFYAQKPPERTTPADGLQLPAAPNMPDFSVPDPNLTFGDSSTESTDETSTPDASDLTTEDASSESADADNSTSDSDAETTDTETTDEVEE